jgi:hypothetical protein
MTRRELLAAFAAATVAVRDTHAHAQTPTSVGRGPEVLKAVAGVPAHVAGLVREAWGFQRTPDGSCLVFDRRAHTVWRISADFETARAIVTIGQEQGRLYVPSAFAVGPNGFFVVADSPGRQDRIQLFDDKGIRLSGFSLGRGAPARITLDTFILGGVSSLAFTGRSVLVNQPETGALVSEYSIGGSALRSFGALRATGHEADRDLHLAFNVGLPLVDPGGGCVFVFVSGEPRFRRYDKNGAVVYERLLQGREVDDLMRRQPTTWPRRTVGGDEVPVVPPTVSAAAVSPDGGLWVALATGEVYVYDADGEKVRAVRLRGAGPLAPNGLAFSPSGRLLVTPGLYEFEVSRRP